MKKIISLALVLSLLVSVADFLVPRVSGSETDSKTWSAWMTQEELTALGRSPSDTNVESKTQYSDRTNSMSTVNSSSPTPPTGYSLLQDNSYWGSWSDWSDTPVSATSTRHVETRTVTVLQGYTQYRYGAWYNGSKSHFCGGSISGAWVRYTDWSTERQTPDKSDTWAYCSNYSHYTNGQHIGYTSYNGTTFYWTRYTIGGKNYYWEESEWVDTSYNKTQYRYQDLVYSFVYYKWNYGTWSAWTDSVLTDSDTNDLSYEVRTRQLYRYYLYNSSVAAVGFAGTYDGNSHSATLTVSGPTSYTIYYSTSTVLTSSNYSSAGSTAKPSRTNTGESTIYYYIKDGTGSYTDSFGSTYIRVLPKITAVPYNGIYDGSPHSPTITAEGNATIYYSASTQLSFSNYSTSGSTTIPSRTDAGSTTVYYIAVPKADATADTCVSGTTTVSVNKKDISVTASGFSGIYNGSSFSPTVNVNGISNYTIYYSTLSQLTSTNYSSVGSTTKPSRTNSGESTVYYYIKDGTGNYNDASGATFIRISPQVTAKAFTGIYSGTAHSPTVSVLGNATLYYSTTTQLNYSNYKSSGTTTMPTRTDVGTTTVYYLAVPNENATGNTCSSGSTTITVTKKNVSVSSSGYSGVYDGNSHSITVSVSDYPNYTVYYSTSSQLTESNFSSAGSTTKPSRTNAGENTVYYYIKDNSGNYNDAAGSTFIRISPKVSAIAFNGSFDGKAHQPTISVSGSATLYYSTSTQLTFSNYSSVGSTTIPTRTAEGMTTVYYIAVPNTNASANTCAAGSTTISIAHTHSFSYSITEQPTFDSTGVLTGTCSCGERATITLPKLSEADYSFETITAATCTQAGTERVTWKNTAYGAISFARETESTAHEYEGIVTSPTCTAQGFTTYTCTRCGDTYTQDYIDALGHDYQNGTCTRCGEADPDYTNPVVFGDINGDGDVTTADTVKLARYLVDLEELTDEQKLAADVNHDGDITSADSILLARFLVGYIDSLDAAPRRGTQQSSMVSVITVGNVSGQKGTVATVPVSISGNPGFAGFTLQLDYPEQIELIEITAGTLLKSSESGALVSNVDKRLVNWSDTSVLTGDGELLLLTFRINEDVAEKCQVTVFVKDGKESNFVDEKGQSILLNPFVDMPAKGHWAFEAINWALGNKITSGTSATTFSPDTGCTRAQVVTFLWRVAGEPEPTTDSNPFEDVAENAYYYKAVLWAAEAGITAGTSAKTFSPDDVCSRGQIVTFIWRYEGSPKIRELNTSFVDVKTGAYYEKAVLWAAEVGITAGTSETTFDPTASCTRAQIVAFLFRINRSM